VKTSHKSLSEKAANRPNQNSEWPQPEEKPFAKQLNMNSLPGEDQLMANRAKVN
jgi:hypothetical protein